MKREPILATGTSIIAILVTLGFIQNKEAWLTILDAGVVAVFSLLQRSQVTPVAKKKELPHD